VSAGTADVALTDRAPTDAALLDHRIAVLPFAFIANRADGASSLTIKQIAGLLTGTIANWNEVGGANVPVKIVSRGASSGVTQLVERKFLNGKKASAADSVAPATGTAVDEVKRTPGAISVVTFDAARAARRRRFVSALGLRTRDHRRRANDANVALSEPHRKRSYDVARPRLHRRKRSRPGRPDAVGAD
jgi:ABC-type phosphate transport system substrate-binding protein